MPEGVHQNQTTMFMGPFPPPVHGQSAATLSIAEQLGAMGTGLAMTDLSGGFRKKLLGHVRAIARILNSPAGPLYLSANSNQGMWLTTLLVLAARVKRRPVFLHHHSYAHVRAPRAAMRALAKIEPGITHIVLSAGMARDLKNNYRHVRNTLVINNAGLIDGRLRQLADRQGHEIVLGHLSNLTEEKGVAVVVDTAIAARSEGLDTRLIIAGPIIDAVAEAAVDRAREALGDRFIYLGPVYGKEKEAFFSGIDVFLFPSRYANEAEPLVLLEAMAAGAICVAFDTGCIADDLLNAGTTVGLDADFRFECLALFRALTQSPEHRADRRKASQARFDSLRAVHDMQVKALARHLTNVASITRSQVSRDEPREN